MADPRPIWLVLFLCALVPLASCNAAQTAAPSSVSPFCVHEVRFTNAVVNEAAAMQDIGAKTARISPYGGLIWDLIEKEKGSYDWAASDYVVSAGSAAGIALFVGVGVQNRLEGTAPGSVVLPKDMEWFLQFLRSAVERYDGDGIDDAPGSPKIGAVQIGNEMDGPAFWQDTPENYALLLKKSYQTIKEAAPDMQVAIGGAATPEGYREFYKPMLAELDRIKDHSGDHYLDIFDLHWSGQFAGDDDYDAISLPTGTYELKAFIADIRSDLAAIGQVNVPFYITEMSDYSDTPAGYASSTETYHASAVIKRYVYALAAGIEKIFWAQMFEEHNAGGEENGYFDNVGLINNPLNADGYSHRKLAYYSYKKMVETLEGSDWKNIQTVQDAGNVRMYGFVKNGKTVYAGWWDYLRDPGYAPGTTKQITITNVQGASMKITEAVPNASSGLDVTDYAAAFTSATLPVSSGSVTLSLGERPVFMEVLP